ncbi:hypothetical protein DFH27DRAFT_476406 [Peziza echinospora]|nr:hypothetical protein DFH27DRAFT_476406 [Peziza echinospora]
MDALSSQRTDVTEVSDVKTVDKTGEVDIEIAQKSVSASGTTSSSWEPLIELPYDLRARKWKIAVIATVVALDGFIVPTCLFYILKYAVKLGDGKNVAITTSAFGFISFVQYFLRLWRLLKKNSPYLPLESTSRWHLDLYQIQFTLGFIAITLVLSFTTQGPNFIRNVALAPSILLVQIGPQFIFSCIAYRLGWKNPFRFSSSLAGEQCVPAVFTIVEDVIGVDGRGGKPFRTLWKGRYLQSKLFREMLYKQTLFWGFGSTLCAGLTFGLMYAPMVDKYVAYGIGWSFPFVWAGIWAVITMLWVQKDLEVERMCWAGSLAPLKSSQAQSVS